MSSVESALEPSSQGTIGPRAVAQAQSWLPLTAMSLWVLCAWLLQHPYRGIEHDATLYSLMALARLHPESLTSDLFLRFGSQDRYTLFGPIFAAAIRLLDLGPAAALLTFLSQVAFIACAWLFARRFMSPAFALLAIGLLLILPSAYGAAHVFRYTEEFLTPRLPAEALVLGGLAAVLAGRRLSAGCCMAAALLLHPIMAMAGIAMLACTFFAIEKPRLAIMLAGVTLAAMIATALAIAPHGRPDAGWSKLIHGSSPYLYVGWWSSADWSAAANSLGLLAIGVLTGRTPLLRRLCGGALLTALCGLLLTAILCDELNLLLALQAQTWRWLWVASVLALLLAPVILRDCWHSGTFGRAAVLLLGSAWLFYDATVALTFAIFGLLCTAVPAAWRNHRYARLLVAGSVGFLVLALASYLGEKVTVMTVTSTSGPALPYALQRIRDSSADGVLPGLLFVLLWWSLQRFGGVRQSFVSCVLATLVCIALLVNGWPQWTHTRYTSAARSEFGAWRQQIPLHAEVLWPDDPVAVWYFLERPNYWSAQQVAGDIFSREKAVLLATRTKAIVAANARPSIMLGLTLPALKQLCADSQLQYIVSWKSFGTSPVAPVSPILAEPEKQLHLAHCADFDG